MVERGTPICSHTILRMDGDPMVVLDTSQDWRFKGNVVFLSTSRRSPLTLSTECRH